MWDCIKRKFYDLDDLRAELKAAQLSELQSQDPLRAELAALDEFIAQIDREADEIAAALRSAQGRVSEHFQRQQDELNERLAWYEQRRAEIIKSLGELALTDESIPNILQYASDVRLGLDHATYEDKRRLLELLKVCVVVKGGKVESITGIVGFTAFKGRVTPYRPRPPFVR